MPLFNQAPPRHYWDSRLGHHIEEDFIASYASAFLLSGTAPIWPQATPIPAGWYGVGGGATGFVTDRVGVDWQLRYFRSVGGVDEQQGLSLGAEQLSFWRASMALVIRY